MPHLIVEYSANLSERLDIHAMLEAIHRAALETGIFPVGGIRTRGVRHDAYVIADEHPENAFVHVQARIGLGRSDEVRQKAAQHIFAALEAFAARDMAQNPLGLSFEVIEMAQVGSFKANTLHDHVARRANAKKAALA